MELKFASSEFAGRDFVLETGKLAQFASGSVCAKFGDIQILVTVGVAPEVKEGGDFLPLSVDFQEKFYASGKIKGSRFIKREGRPSDDCILTARVIDRPIRPMFPKGMRNEVQVVATVLSTDKSMNAGPLAITAASMAILLSGAPFEQAVSAVRIGRQNGEFILMPTYEQIEKGDMELVVAGTKDAITMVEAQAKEVPDEEMLKALDFAHGHIKKLCELQEELLKKCDIKAIKIEEAVLSEDLCQKVESLMNNEMMDALYSKGKKEFKDALYNLTEKVLENFADEIECESCTEANVEEAVYKMLKKYMRENVLSKGKRLSGREVAEVRKINCEVGLLPRVHGSGLFNRGETQVLSCVTLGGPSSAQVEDTMDTDTESSFWHYYTFLPFAVGEVRSYRGVGRREIGHGKLAEKALRAVLPEKEQFPYTIAIVSETLACNGSSSMGSVCGSTLALMDAGVPIKRPVTAIAMGLIMDQETGEYKILSDIEAQEDFLGDMDFKVAGTEKGITALQMDIKVKGLKLTLLEEALKQAKIGRNYIWDGMSKALSAPRPVLNKNAPLIDSFKIDENDVKIVIGRGGETIQKITKECGVEINIDDETHLVTITAPDRESGNKASQWIKRLVYKPQVGDIFEGKVVRVENFGAFVEFVPGKDGLVHVSELSDSFVKDPGTIVKIGDILPVKLMKIDDQGRYNLSHIKAKKEVKGIEN
ncbi:polyribonucleotide nucleotidyltransferase [Candidatus Peregrinibacteria bacterium RIFOXYB2_FULL_32_7]|nr:MAG: polyribonucleotide nucleotidyltransferase [Candidatus Peregrinibacteria bacterium RIFOXYB2_FULL_32_7]